MKRLIFMSVMVLAGCQTFPQLSVDDDPSTSCYRAIADRKEVQILKPRIGSFLDPNAATLEMRASTTKANPEEKQALSHWASARMECQKAGEAFRASNNLRNYNALLVEQNANFINLLTKLYTEEWGYGKFIEARIALGQEAQRKWNEAERRQQSDYDAKRQADAVQQMQLNNSLMLLQAAQPQPVAPLRPQVNCTSRNVMGTVQTNCW
jgi:hypothetical protein